MAKDFAQKSAETWNVVYYILTTGFANNNYRSSTHTVHKNTEMNASPDKPISQKPVYTGW